MIGVLGENGAAKTTLLELILGFTPASAGSVRVFEHDSCRLPAAGKARIGFVPQQDEMLDQLAVRDQLSLIRSFYPHWNEALVARLATKWRIDRDERIRDLSVGQRQKLAILLALGHEPDLLALDEPMASLDPVARRHFLEQIVDIAGDRGRSVILSSHIVSDIARLADKIWLIKDGGLYWSGECDDLKDHVVRLHLISMHDLPSELAIPNAVSVERGFHRCSSRLRPRLPACRSRRPVGHPDLEARLGPRRIGLASSARDLALRLGAGQAVARTPYRTLAARAACAARKRARRRRGACRDHRHGRRAGVPRLPARGLALAYLLAHGSHVVRPLRRDVSRDLGRCQAQGSLVAGRLSARGRQRVSARALHRRSEHTVRLDFLHGLGRLAAVCSHCARRSPAAAARTGPRTGIDPAAARRCLPAWTRARAIARHGPAVDDRARTSRADIDRRVALAGGERVAVLPGTVRCDLGGDRELCGAAQPCAVAALRHLAGRRARSAHRCSRSAPS